MIAEDSYLLVDRPRPRVVVLNLNRPERMHSMALDVMVPPPDVLNELTYVVGGDGAGLGCANTGSAVAATHR